MDLTLVVLKNGATLVTLVEQLEYEPRVHLRNPQLVSGKTKLVLSPYPAYTDDTDILIHSDMLLTLCVPTQAVREAYLKKTGLTEEDLKAPEAPVTLDEDETVPEGDEYEPRYYEEPLP